VRRIYTVIAVVREYVLHNDGCTCILLNTQSRSPTVVSNNYCTKN
jgi:hypothetical protein